MSRNQSRIRSGENRYESKAHRVLIPEFRMLRIEFLTLDISSEPSAVPNYSFSPVRDGYYPDFPVIIQGNGEPWDIGNLYLTTKLFTDHRYESRTYRGIADHLLDYLRFLEDENIDFLFFPRNDRLKVTYRYRHRLEDQKIAGEISASTGRARINNVINFYRGIMSWSLVEKGRFEHQPFEDVWKYFNSPNKQGFSRLIRIKSHNLAMKTPKKQHDPEYISDGGDLCPLTVTEQEDLLRALLESSRGYQLMFYFALFTGARIQTIGTVRTKHLNGKLDSNGYLRLPVGGGTQVDTKFDKPMTLLVPGWLVNDLITYSRSPEAVARRRRSYYGDTVDNYIFLAKTGTPYYTSKKEILDRRNQLDSGFYGIADGARNVSKKDGGTVRTYIHDVLLPRIRLRKPDFKDFSFHDLRATFGMNLLESQLQNLPQGQAITSAIEYVQCRMGHRDKSTTLQYLNYKSRLEWRASVQHEFEAGLFKYVNSLTGVMSDNEA